MRKLASIRRITNLLPIDGADAIETAVIDGWQTVVKKGEYTAGDLVVFLEIDSWVPNSLAPFLTHKDKQPRVYEGVPGERLRTVKLRGQISQGLVLPLSVIPEPDVHSIVEGDDVTTLLGVLKWEPAVSVTMGGQARGNFPSFIPKTDQERVQNIRQEVLDEWFSKYTWELSEKLYGCSATYYIDADDKFHACSRNIDLTDSEDNLWWNVARKYEIEDTLRLFKKIAAEQNGDENIIVAIQGEIVGPGVNGNMYKFEEHEFFAFDLFVPTATPQYCPKDVLREMIVELQSKNLVKFNYVPSTYIKANQPVAKEILLKGADEGFSHFGDGILREGFVFCAIEDPSVSFKVVSNAWLLKTGE
jgi:RNA ligase (TIGR02306 family)